jgi:phage shock protein A
VALGESLGRARVAAAKWEARLRDEILPRAGARVRVLSTDEAMASLREQAEALDGEIVGVLRRRSDLLGQQSAVAQRAMHAIRMGDDRTAHRVLKDSEALTEALIAIEADLKVLRAMSTECRRALEPPPSVSAR